MPPSTIMRLGRFGWGTLCGGRCRAFGTSARLLHALPAANVALTPGPPPPPEKLPPVLEGAVPVPSPFLKKIVDTKTGSVTGSTLGRKKVTLARAFAPPLSTAVSTMSATTEGIAAVESAGIPPASSATATPVPVYEAPSVLGLVRDFQTHQPRALVVLPHTLYATPIRRDILHRCVIWQRDAQRQGTHSTKGRADVRGTTRKQAPQKGRGKARIYSHRAPQFRGGGVAHGPHPRDHSTSLQVKVRELGIRSAISSKYASNSLILTQALSCVAHRGSSRRRRRGGAAGTASSVPPPTNRALKEALNPPKTSVPNAPAVLRNGKTQSLAAVLDAHYPPLTASGFSAAATHSGRKYSSVLIVVGTQVVPLKLARAAKNLPDVKVIPASSINVYDILRHEYLVLDHVARKYLEWRLAVKYA